jgi:hypothetical protein
MDKLCATCGKQLQPDQTLCEQCGAVWTPAVGASPATPPSPAAVAPLPPALPVPVPVQTAGTGGSGKTVMIAAIVVIAALGIAGWLFMRSRAAGTSVATKTAPSSITGTSPTPVRKASNGVQVAAVGAPVAGEALPVAPPVTAADTEAAAGSKPCSLVTRAEMETILGAKIVKVTTTDLACSYFTDETMSAQVETTWIDGKGAYAQVKAFNSAPGLAEPVTGIGDEAYLQAAGVLHVLKNDTYVVVNSREYPDELKTESAIATKAMEKLKL